MKKNLLTITLVLTIVAIFTLGCGMLKDRIADKEVGKTNSTSSNDSGSPKNNNVVPTNSAPTNAVPVPATSGEHKGNRIVKIDDKAVASYDSVDFMNEKKTWKNVITPLDKIHGKIIEVTGRVSRLYPEKNGVLLPNIQLVGGDPIIDDIGCNFDPENKDEIKSLKVDQLVTLKGLVPKMWIVGLEHCVIVKAD
jgi:hypothetical protein